MTYSLESFDFEYVIIAYWMMNFCALVLSRGSIGASKCGEVIPLKDRTAVFASRLTWRGHCGTPR